jgi:hypothetical protein
LCPSSYLAIYLVESISCHIANSKSLCAHTAVRSQRIKPVLVAAKKEKGSVVSAVILTRRELHVIAGVTNFNVLGPTTRSLLCQ